jgi:hypothetical protein
LKIDEREDVTPQTEAGRTCSKCKSPGADRGGYCKPCRSEYYRSWYVRNLEKARKDRLDRQRGIVSGTRAIVNEIKSNPCSDCKVRYPPWVMQFDHVRGEKVADVAKMMWRSKDRVLAEIAKCDLVCANCHAHRTHLRRQRPAGHSKRRKY